MNKNVKILMLEDVPEDAELVKHALQKEEIRFVSYLTDNKPGFIKGLKEFEPDLVLSDYSLPLFNGLEALELVKEISPEIPFIMVTGSINEETAVECMKRGAWDYVIKENLTRLGYAVLNALKLKEENDKIKLAENELRKLSTAINQSPSSIVITDIEGAIEYVNPYFTKLTGYTEEEVIGQKPKILQSGKTPLKTYEQLWKTILSGNTWEGEFVNKKKNGDHYWESAIITPVKNEKNEITNLIAIKHNITKRKKSEQIQKLLYNISNAVITTNNLEELIHIIKNELETIIDTTNFYIALYNSETDSISFPFFVDEKDKLDSIPAGKSLTGYVIKIKKSLLANTEVKKKLVKEGKLEYVGSLSKLWLGVPLKIKGEVTGVLAVQSYTDENAYNESDVEMLEFIADQVSISIERKKTEQNLITALEKATESDRLKSTFLAAMSHELRTPLNAIIGFSDFIDNNLPLETIVDFCKIINSSGNHLLSIVEDLFDITLIESGEIQIVKEKIKLQLVLNDVQEIIKAEQQKTDKKNIDLNLIIPQGGKDLIIKTDSSKLKQILINLLKNALKFTHEGHIKYGFNIETDQDKPMLKFFVEDTGIGIPKEKQEFIFDIFRQVEDSHTRSYGGTGIGLSITRKLTELLGGQIWIESEKGAGSTFYFTLPLNEVVEITDSTKKEAEKKKLFKEKTILIVEDDRSSFEYLKTVLSNPGINIIWAENGEESVTLCEENPNIDLVLMDVNLPVMDGYTATKIIKKFRPKLPIIAQTAHAIAGDHEKSLDAGCDDYISKPIKKEELMRKIGKLL